MYMPMIVWRMCARKTSYPTKRQAKIVANHIRHETGGRLSTYRCPFCSTYHVGRRYG